MGNEDPIRSSTEKLRSKVDELNLQLHAQTARSSHLQSRLTSVLDGMETLQHTHEQELAKERDAKQRLNIKLECLVEYTEAVEEERDELRDAVLALVEKVEGYNDDSAWPYSRIRLPDILEPLKPLSGKQPSPGPSTPVADDYSALIVAALRAELEKERSSHAQTHDRAELEILCLRSQLARRDAELQAYATHRDHSAEPVGPQPSRKSTPTPFTPEEAVRVLGLSTARNRELEAEIKNLAVRLEQARAPPRRPSSRGDRAAPSSSNPPTVAGNEPQASSPLRKSNPTPPAQPSPPSPNLQPRASQDSPSPYILTPRNTGTPRRSHLAYTLQPDINIAEDVTAHIEFTHKRDAFFDFSEEVKRLGVEIDALKKEREEWKERLADPEATLTVGRVGPSHTQIETVKQAYYQGDHDQLAMLRAEFEEFKQVTAERETALELEITKLRRVTSVHQTVESPGETETLVTFSGSPSGFPAAGSPPSRLVEGQLSRDAITRNDSLPSSPQEHTTWEESDTEQSMDLATPLQPTVVLTDGDTIVITNAPLEQLAQQPPETDAAPLDPPLVPLPESPILSPAPLSPAGTPPPAISLGRSAAIHDRPPTPFSFAHAPEMDESGSKNNLTVVQSERLQGVERELEVAKREITERDQDLTELSRVLDDLRMQVREARLRGLSDHLHDGYTSI